MYLLSIMKVTLEQGGAKRPAVSNASDLKAKPITGV